ncbi:hypothetical protein BGX26_005115, partial [Mortierella sp. AD094]
STKNTTDETFEVSLQVFVDKRQTPIHPQDASAASLSFSDLRQRTTKGQIVRLRSPQTPNRFKTVESPVFIKAPQTALQTATFNQSTPGAQSQQLTTVTEQLERPTTTTQGCSSHPDQIGHPPLPRTRTPKKNRPRYSFKRQDLTKPYKEPERKPDKPKSKSKPKPAPKSLSDSTAKTDKLGIARMMNYQHPTISLYIGTLSANVKRALPNQDRLQQEVMSVHSKAASEAARIKRQAQMLIGKYIECLVEKGLERLDAEDQKFLDLLCPRVIMKDVKNNADDATEDDDDDELACLVEEDYDDEEDRDEDNSDLGGQGGDGNAQRLFLSSFLVHLYSGNLPTKPEAAKFIDRLKGLHPYNPPRTRAEINQTMPFRPTDLVRSVVGQLKGELKRMYKRGACDLHKTLKKKIEKGQLDKSKEEIQIRGELSAIENYIALNKLSLNPRRIVPMTSSRQPCVGFTERELAGFYFKSGGVLKEKLMELATKDGIYPTIDEVESWVGKKEPGFLIQNFVADIDPKGLKGQQKRKAGRRGKIKGTVLTDGFGLYLLAFKLKELQSVRFRRLPDDRLPLRIMSTVRGTDYYLQEIRNVIRTKEDIKQLWPKAKDPRDIKILTLDAGQAFVVGAYAYLPEDPDAHYNLAVNQKAVLQPVFRHRRWLEGEKESIPDQQTKSIAHAESNLPPLRGPGASVVEYVKKLEEVEEQLSEFYNGANYGFKKHDWDKTRPSKQSTRPSQRVFLVS